MRDDEKTSNPSGNRPFTEVLEVNLSRRKILAGGLASAASAFLSTPALSLADSGSLTGRNKHLAIGKLLDFQPVKVAHGSGPLPSISADYEYQTLISWGEKLYPSAPARAYDGNPGARPTADDQKHLIGIGHDGMHFFPEQGQSNSKGMLCINHEFGENAHVLGKADPESLEDVRLSQHAHGVSVVALENRDGSWRTIDSPHARRIHVNTPVTFSGPAAGHPLLQNEARNPFLGTVNNCSDGQTPWGTYLSCEENFDNYFGATGAWDKTEARKRYGFEANGSGYGWHNFDPRFDLSRPDYRNESNRFGWVVEIDPDDGSQVPVKRTALGRFKHEGAAVTVGRGGRVVVYMGDDERFDYIYKFVSDDDWKSMRARGLSPLDHGKLYVARFNDNGTGDWLELTRDNEVLARKFSDQGEMLTYARLAADALGATPMDRPEWASVAPNGEVYCTLTKNSERAETDAANPLAPNPDGHIIKWLDNDQHTGTRFAWDIFLFAHETHGTEETFTAPDGLWADPDGRLFIQTDGDQKDGLNNQMLVADTRTGELRRLFTGVTGDEITGITVTPDRRTMFINTQHPGNGNPALTNFPAPQGSGKIPRDTTFVIRRKDGGIVGS